MLAIILVNYKSDNKTVDYITNQLSKISIQFVVVIVNNSATESSNIFLKTSLNAEIVYDIGKKNISDSRCFILSSRDNLGFARGNNYGFEFIDKNFNCKFILFTNNDLIFVDNNIVEELINKLNEMDDIAAIGPKVVGLDNKLQSPEPFYSFFYRYFYRFWIKNNLIDYAENALEGKHYKIMGSFIIFKSSDFKQCGWMDPSTFLFSEEVILSERLKLIKKYMYYYPGVAVIHEHSAVISENYNYFKVRLMQFKSEAYYYKEYIGINRFYIFLGSCSNYLYSFIKFLIK